MPRQNLIAVSLVVLFLGFAAPSALAATTYTWNSPAGGSWNTATNWTTGAYSGSVPTTNSTLPTPADSVIVTAATTGTITLDANQFCASLTLDCTAAGLTLSPGAAALQSTITNKVGTGTVVTITTSAAHGYVVGDTILVGCNLPDANIDTATATLTAVTTATPFTFTYNKTATAVATVATAGIARKASGNFALTLGTAGGTISHADTLNGTVTISCPITLTGATNIGVAAGTGKLDFALGSAITGNAFAITINGAPTVGLGAAAGAVEFLNVLGDTAGLFNSFTGAISVNAGARLNFVGNNNTGDTLALGTGAKTITWNGGTIGILTTSANPQSTNVKNFVIGATGGTLDTNGLTFQLDDAGQLTGAGGGTLTKVNTGTFLLSGQTYVVGAGTSLVVKAGTLQLNSNNQVFGSAATNTITLDGGVMTVIAANSSYPNNIAVASTGTITNPNSALSQTSFGSLTLNAGASLTLANGGGLNSSFLFTGGSGNAIGNGATLTNNDITTLNGTTTFTTAATLAGSANLKIGGAIAGAGTITKTNTAILTYDGASTSATLAINSGSFAEQRHARRAVDARERDNPDSRRPAGPRQQHGRRR